MEAAKTEGLTILWVPVRPSLYERTVIFAYQAAHPPALPLSMLEYAYQEDALVKIAKIIEEALLATTVTPMNSVEKTAKATAGAGAGLLGWAGG